MQVHTPSKVSTSVATHGLALIAASLCAALTGCTLVSNVPDSNSDITMPPMSGRVMGGETPVASSLVTLWETDPTHSGYGASAKVLAGPVTASSPGGNFSFTTGYTCTPGNFVYVTSTGGDTSNGAATAVINRNLILAAALGPCSSFGTAAQQASVNVIVNELSTVAVAFALGAFTTVNAGTTGGTTYSSNQQVYIGAPANNNAATGACTGTGTAMTCVAAGLSHAFTNAATLVNASSLSGGPVGTANTTVPGNSLGSVPTALINTLGNILQFCTNSAGGVAGDGSNCGLFFTDATPPAGLAAPTDTLSAMIDIARAPYDNTGKTCSGTNGTTGGLFCLSSAYPSFVPALSSVPHDYSIAIAYSGASNLTTTSFGSPQYLVLDANDNVYVQTSNAYSATAVGIAAMTNSGSGLWNNPTNSNLCTTGEVAIDNVGNAWMSIFEASTATGCAFGIYEYNASTGAQENFFEAGSGSVCNTTTPSTTNCPGFVTYDTTHAIQSTPRPIAFDRFNNLWYGRGSSSCSNCLLELPYSTTTYAATGNYGAPTNVQNTMYSTNQIVIDSGQNIWIGNYSASSGTSGKVFLVPNTGTAAAPAYTATSGFFTTTLSSYDNGGVSLDASGNVWTGSSLDVYSITPTGSGATLALPSSPTFTAAIAASHPSAGEVDGGSNYWYPSLTSSGSLYLQITPTAAYYNSTTPANNIQTLRPCYVPAGSNTCDAALLISSLQYYESGDPHVIQVDSSGALWVAAGVTSNLNTGFILQVLGPGYPTWPLYNYGVFGKEPQ